MNHPNGEHYNHSYGEAKWKAKEEAPIVKGEAVVRVERYQHGPRMLRANAVKYYNEKLRHYWLDRLDKRIPYGQRKKALKYLLGDIS
jgi:hypothetical protein